MTNLITLDSICLAFGLAPLLDHVQLQIAEGERICLIGRNGAGKSSLMKIIDGQSLPDSGQVWRKSHLRVARLSQELPQDTQATVYEYVAKGLEGNDALLEFWEIEYQINNVLSRLGLDGERQLSTLSGGWQRRVALAQALVSSPELLLLDEPTNHLDIETIQWLEEQLLTTKIGLLFITHDRALLRRLATRIIELDRGQLTSWPGDYDNFLRRKEEMLHAEAKQNADFDKKLAEEERWIRQGIKARRTRNEGRVRALKAMRVDRAKRREQQGRAAFAMNAGEQSGQVVVEAKHVSQTFNGKTVIQDFSIRLLRGDKIGLVGPNGIGKSTLLNILLGKLSPEQGAVTLGTKLQVAYSDQLRQQLDLNKTVMDNVAEGRQYIDINGKQKHIISYLADFLFTPERCFTPVKALSGGECNRLLLARLFSLPFNCLVLDEPTNDLDIETLELLEELLTQFEGTLLLVSHDRNFLDNVVTSILAFEGNGHIQEYVGGYQDLLRQQKLTHAPSTPARESETKSKATSAPPSKKMSYKDQRELEALPKRIEGLEETQRMLQQQVSDPAFYQQPPEKVAAELTKLKQLTDEIEQAYARWHELE